ncbi:hypothetical protein ACHAXR_007906 [Thalassiosira sp. AJA248-18]
MKVFSCAPIIIISAASLCGAFSPSYHHSYRILTAALHSSNKHPLSSLSRTLCAAAAVEEEGASSQTITHPIKPTPTTTTTAIPPPSLDKIRLEASASSGIECHSELPRILDVIASVCQDYGVLPPLLLDSKNMQCSESPFRSESIPGLLGRVLLLRVHGLPPTYVGDDDDDLLAQLKNESAERIDAILNGDDNTSNNQPILLAFHPVSSESNDHFTIEDVIEKEIMDYGLREEVNDNCQIDDQDNAACFVHPMQFEINCYPSVNIEIDGAMIETIESHNHDDDGERQLQQHFDTSSVLVFDKVLDKGLRKSLLNVVKGHPENDHDSDHKEDQEWNDIENGPDPTRWVRGGLVDVVDDEEKEEGTSNDDDNGNKTQGSSCWGLADEAILDICYNDHPAIAELESKLVQLFPDFIVTRLPEAVLGPCVSPLTANAPTHGDTFTYHIDADPLQVPPSPWADVFGRYPNRSRGMPRFVSCLLYLNDEWDEENWGAPTRFLDPPTQQTYDVFPKPGRCVIMDQDITHTVVAPKIEAGKQRPRYSLVLKLILHPKVEGQDMELSCGRKNLWPEPVVVGSANNEMDLS